MVTTIVNTSFPVGHPGRMIEIDGYTAESYSETPSQPEFTSEDIMGRSSPIQFYNYNSARQISFSMKFHRDMISPWTSTVYPGMPGIEGNPNYVGLYTSGEKSTSITIGGKSYDFYDSNQDFEAEWKAQYDRFYKDVKKKENELNVLSGVSVSEWIDYNKNAEADATARFQIFINKLRALNYPTYATNGVIAPGVYLKIGDTLKLKGYCKVSFDFDSLNKFNTLLSFTANFDFTEVVDQAWSSGEILTGMQRYVKWYDNALNLR